MALAFDHPALNIHVPAHVSPVTQVLMAAVVMLVKWETRARTRADLREMDPSRYADLGLTTAEVLREVDKPFWQA
ncbi:MAG: hypothetical protein AAGF30_14105 [Pseudomonadota bacterium]